MAEINRGRQQQKKKRRNMQYESNKLCCMHVTKPISSRGIEPLARQGLVHTWPRRVLVLLECVPSRPDMRARSVCVTIAVIEGERGYLIMRMERKRDTAPMKSLAQGWRTVAESHSRIVASTSAEANGTDGRLLVDSRWIRAV